MKKTSLEFQVLKETVNLLVRNKTDKIWDVTKPFNIASYALLTMMMAQVFNLEPGDFIHTFGDAHIYSNHFAQVDEQLSRTPQALPSMLINPNIKDLFDFSFEDFELQNYKPAAHISAPIAV